MSTVNAFESNPSHPAPGAHPHDLEACGHTVQFYAEDQSLISGLTRLIATALVTGNSAIVIATKAHRRFAGRRLGYDEGSVARSLHPP